MTIKLGQWCGISWSKGSSLVDPAGLFRYRIFGWIGKKAFRAYIQ